MVLKYSLAFMKYFRFVIGEFVVSFFDVTNRLIILPKAEHLGMHGSERNHQLNEGPMGCNRHKLIHLQLVAILEKYEPMISNVESVHLIQALRSPKNKNWHQYISYTVNKFCTWSKVRFNFSKNNLITYIFGHISYIEFFQNHFIFFSKLFESINNYIPTWMHLKKFQVSNIIL